MLTSQCVHFVLCVPTCRPCCLYLPVAKNCIRQRRRQQFKQVQKRQSATWESTAHVESAPRNALKIRMAVKCVIWGAAKSISDLKVRGTDKTERWTQTEADSRDEGRWRWIVQGWEKEAHRMCQLCGLKSATSWIFTPAQSVTCTPANMHPTQRATTITHNITTLVDPSKREKRKVQNPYLFLASGLDGNSLRGLGPVWAFCKAEVDVGRKLIIGCHLVV